MTDFVVDAGGTRLKAGVVDDGVLGRTAVYEVTGGAPILDVVARAARELIPGDAPGTAAICVPGLVDDHGTLVSLPGKHEGLEGTNLADAMREMLGVERAVVTNDAVAYAIGEAAAGAGRGARRSVIVTIGTGVGVGVIERGRPVSGGIYGGGILGGFIPIADEDGPSDSNGTRGTIEALCAAERIVGCCEGAYTSVPDVFDAFARGEEPARAGVAAYRARLTRALVALASAHTPDRIILGGGPMREDNPITPGIEAAVNERMFGTYRTEVRLAELGDAAALAGLVHVLEATAP